ncbi:MAG: hypothetical protein ACYC6M_15870 [Terriglobales bacterium]
MKSYTTILARRAAGYSDTHTSHFYDLAEALRWLWPEDLAVADPETARLMEEWSSIRIVLPEPMLRYRWMESGDQFHAGGPCPYQGVIVNVSGTGIFVCKCGNPCAVNLRDGQYRIGAHPQGPEPVNVQQFKATFSADSFGGGPVEVDER